MSATTYSTRAAVLSRISAAAACSSLSWRLEITTAAPASAKIVAMALPSPRLPPVTRATRPVKSNSLLVIAAFSLSAELILQFGEDPGEFLLHSRVAQGAAHCTASCLSTRSARRRCLATRSGN